MQVKTRPSRTLPSSSLKKVFLTGATGYVGNQLLRLLLSTGHEVNVVARRARKCEMLHWPHTRVFIGDLSDTEMIASAMEGCEYVYHTAAYAKLWAPDPKLIYETNVKGTYNVLTEAKKQQVKKIVYTSSAGVLGNSLKQPLTEEDPRIFELSNDYDISKSMAEEMVKSFNTASLETVIVIPSRIFGGGILNYSNALSRILLEVLEGKIAPVPACMNVIANYSFIDDVVFGHLLAMQNGRAGERYILGGENITYRQLYSMISDLTGRKNFFPLPLSVMKIVGYLNLINYRLFGKDPAFTPSMIERYFTNAALSSEKAIQELGYKITPMEEALKLTIAQLNLYRHST